MADIEVIKTPILGVDGRPLVPVEEDAIKAFLAAPQQTRDDLYMMAGRMLRDGRSLKEIKYNCTFGAPELVTDRQMESFARMGLALLNARIALGLERAETVVTVMTDQLDIEEEALGPDADLIDPMGVNNVDAGYRQDMS
jgi:hypothetical protein